MQKVFWILKAGVLTPDYEHWNFDDYEDQWRNFSAEEIIENQILRVLPILLRNSNEVIFLKKKAQAEFEHNQMRLPPGTYVECIGNRNSDLSLLCWWLHSTCPTTSSFLPWSWKTISCWWGKGRNPGNGSWTKMQNQMTEAVRTSPQSQQAYGGFCTISVMEILVEFQPLGANDELGNALRYKCVLVAMADIDNKHRNWISQRYWTDQWCDEKTTMIFLSWAMK